ncbi:MAG: DeoR/GlpR family DNA-binding transcription regulator [Gemmatimonadaceae bacterium]|nr:DeoR/GlpR family DNA-binding transcription regulator [Gemmatimonadaceae bacterium]
MPRQKPAPPPTPERRSHADPASPPGPDDAPRFAEERQARIAATLREQGRVEVGALALEYGCSDDTIRRDLRALAARGLVQKTHGGAVAVQTLALPVGERMEVRAASKRAIARAAGRRVQPHESLFIDGGSTALAFAQWLAGPDAPRPLTIITPSFDVAALFVAAPQVQLVIAGGTWSPENRECYGEQAVATIRAHRAEWAFLGACAVHPRAGITSTFTGDAAVKRAMIDSAATRVVLVDASKHGIIAPHAVADLAAIDLVVTDAVPRWLVEAVGEVLQAT